MSKHQSKALPDLTQEQRELLERIYALYYDQMLAKAYRILQNMQDSEECVNDTWLITWNSKGSLILFCRGVHPDARGRPLVAPTDK